MAIAIETAVNFGDVVNDGAVDYQIIQVSVDGEAATQCLCYAADGATKMIAGGDLTLGAL